PPPYLHSFPTRRSSDLLCRSEPCAFLFEARNIQKMPPKASTLTRGDIRRHLPPVVGTSRSALREIRRFFGGPPLAHAGCVRLLLDRKSTRLNSSHEWIS